jgi:hypothetical protein
LPQVTPQNFIVSNQNPTFVAQQKAEQLELRKREEKEEAKRIARAAKEQGRANRDDDMDFFAAYYKEYFHGKGLISLKKCTNHPRKI